MEFYLKMVKQENYSKRELDRQISASLFERTMIGNSKLSTALRESNLVEGFPFLVQFKSRIFYSFSFNSLIFRSGQSVAKA